MKTGGFAIPIARSRYQRHPRTANLLRALWRYELLLISQIREEWWPANQLRSAQLRLKRLKKQKLQLKDEIARLEDRLYPDIIA